MVTRSVADPRVETSDVAPPTPRSTSDNPARASSATLQVPAAIRPASAEHPNVPRPASEEAAPAFVVVIESNESIAAPLESALRRGGFRRRVTQSPRDAIENFEVQRPDVILLSVSASDSDPVSDIEMIRRAPGARDIPIGLLAMLPRDELRTERALRLDSMDVFRVPIEPIETITRIRLLTRLRRRICHMERETVRLNEQISELERVSIRDPLTGLYNRRQLEVRLTEEVERALRYGQPLSIMFVDIDHFKSINDTHGHGIGDAVLREVAGILRQCVRRVDLVARVGGEEFVIVTPSTGREGALAVAERIRARLAAAPIIATSGSGLHKSIHLTASLGTATLLGRDGPSSMTPEQFLEHADAALYRAKSHGRNRVEYAEELG